MVLLHVSLAKIVVNGAEDLPQSVPTLRPCGVIHHVVGNEIVKNPLVTVALTAKQFVDHRSRFSHPSMVPSDWTRQPSHPPGAGNESTRQITRRIQGERQCWRLIRGTYERVGVTLAPKYRALTVSRLLVRFFSLTGREADLVA